MNGKKIVLLTTLIAFLVLITVGAVFARFVLDIDLGGVSLAPGEEETQQEQLQEENQPNSNQKEETQPESQKEETSGQTAEQKPNQKEDKQEGTQPQKEEKEEEKEEEFAFPSDLKSAGITIQGEQPYELKVEDSARLTQLLEQLKALKLMSVSQSVGLQDAKWTASLSLSLKDGTAVSVHSYQSTLSGSKTTLSTGNKTYESTASADQLKKLLDRWVEEDQKSKAPAIAPAEFAAASRVLTFDPFSMEVQDVAASKSTIQAALAKLEVTETLSGNINPGVEYIGTNTINLSDDTHTLFTLEFYETGILAYKNPGSGDFYVCEPNSLKQFYQSVEQVCSQYAAVPAQLALMDYGAFDGAQASSTTGTSRKEVGLIRDHAQTLFYFLQQLHVKKGSMREESTMFKRPEYHVDLEFDSGLVVGIDINKGSLLIDSGNGTIHHYTLIGDSNLELVRAELERLTADE